MNYTFSFKEEGFQVVIVTLLIHPSPKRQVMLSSASIDLLIFVSKWVFMFVSCPYSKELLRPSLLYYAFDCKPQFSVLLHKPVRIYLEVSPIEFSGLPQVKCVQDCSLIGQPRIRLDCCSGPSTSLVKMICLSGEAWGIAQSPTKGAILQVSLAHATHLFRPNVTSSDKRAPTSIPPLALVPGRGPLCHSCTHEWFWVEGGCRWEKGTGWGWVDR